MTFRLTAALTPTPESVVEPESGPCRSLKLSAALFEDGSAEGDAQAIESLRMIRHGRLIALKRLLPIIPEDPAAVSDVNSIETLRTKVSAFSLATSDPSADGHLVSGMRSAQWEVASKLREIAQSSAPGVARSLGEDLIRVKRLLTEEQSALQREESAGTK